MRPTSPHLRLLAACLLVLWPGAVTSLRAGAAGAVAAGQATAEPVVIVVNRQNPVDTLSVADLRRLLLGERTTWPDGRKATVVMRPPDDPDRTLVLRQICRMGEQDYARHLLQSSFVGDATSGPKQLSTASGVRRFIFNVPGAIGYLRAGEVDDSVKVIRIDNRAPTDAAYVLRGEAR